MIKRIRLLAASLAAGIIAPLFALVPMAGATASVTVVRPADMATSLADVISDPQSWFFYNDENDTIDNTLGTFVNGPATPPAGNGSVQISVSGTQRRNLATYQFAGTKLSEIQELKFSTYNPSAGNGSATNRSGFLNFNVSFDGVDSWQRRLVYVPNQNGTVNQDSWQEWDTVAGGNALWTWSGFDSNGGKWLDNNTNRYRTWNDILTTWPDIQVRDTDSWLGIRVGEPYADGYTENIDKFVFKKAGNKQVFDFEPTYQPTGSIKKPLDGRMVKGTVQLKAVYDDGDKVNDDAVQWAVRAGTCAANTNTVWGNVDGHADAYQWNGRRFTSELKTWQLDPGMYCFVFNPTDDAGQNDVRETRVFYVAPRKAADCRQNGWQNFGDNFNNQGQCMKYVQRHKKWGHMDDWCRWWKYWWWN